MIGLSLPDEAGHFMLILIPVFLSDCQQMSARVSPRQDVAWFVAVFDVAPEGVDRPVDMSFAELTPAALVQLGGVAEVHLAVAGRNRAGDDERGDRE